MIQLSQPSKGTAEVVLETTIGAATVNVSFYPTWQTIRLDSEGIVNDKTQATALLTPPTKYRAAYFSFTMRTAATGETLFHSQIEHTPGNAIIYEGTNHRTVAMPSNVRSSGVYTRIFLQPTELQGLRVKFTARITSLGVTSISFHGIFFEY